VESSECHRAVLYEQTLRTQLDDAQNLPHSKLEVNLISVRYYDAPIFSLCNLNV